MKKLLALPAIAFLFLLGCNAPTYQDCCLYANASDSGICVMLNGTIYDDSTCDMELLTCNVTLDDRELEIPLCPKVDKVRCNTSCVGVFCGSFDYDPRPLPSPADDMQSDDEESQERVTAGSASERGPINLFQSECRVKNITPAFLRAAKSTGGFTLNVFRFGVGNSFAEFDEAMAYFPLTDLSCRINMYGTKDRYVNYVLPNSIDGSEKLCRFTGILDAMYICNIDSTIESHSYYDCASRCALAYQGYEPNVDPDNPYPTENEAGELVGNPFSYGIYGTYSLAPAEPLVLSSKYRDQVDMSGITFTSTSPFKDEYQPGYNFYGATFRKSDSLSAERGGIDWAVARYGLPIFFTDSIYDYYSGEMEDTDSMEFSGSTTVFTTAEQDLHGAYIPLLTHHSVYADQLAEGHRLDNGSWMPGAEFECADNSECISGFCNTFDYHRGNCIPKDKWILGEYISNYEVPCGCWEYQGETLCPGMQSYEAQAWDDTSERVRATAALSAPVRAHKELEVLTPLRSMPSKGRVFSHEDDETGETIPYVVIQVGGESRHPTYGYTNFGALDMAGVFDDESYRAAMAAWLMAVDARTLTIDQALSRDKWGQCGTDCGKFYTTFAEACMPEWDSDPDAYDYFHMCREFPEVSGGSAPPAAVYGKKVSPSTGEAVDSGFCASLNGNSELYDEVFCYERNIDDDCVAWSTTAIVVEPRPVTYRDEEGREIAGYAFGNCLADEDGTELLTHTYGICEQCTFLTLAKQEIVPLPQDEDDPGYPGSGDREDNKYCPNVVVETPYEPNDPAVTKFGSLGPYDEWQVGGTHGTEDYSQCYMPDYSENGLQEAWADYLPNAYYLKRKTESYLVRGVMPVIVATNDSLWEAYTSPGGERDWALMAYYWNHITRDDEGYARVTIDASHPYMIELAENEPQLLEQFAQHDEAGEYYAFGGPLLLNGIQDMGAAIIIVGNQDLGDWSSIPLFGAYSAGGGASNRDRARAVRLICPNCMVAVGAGYTGYGGDAENSYQRRLDFANFLFRYQNESTHYILNGPDSYNLTIPCEDPRLECDNEALNLVDVLAMKWELSKEDSFCEIENEQERFQAILDAETGLGSRMLARFHKPVVITDFSIVLTEFDTCWDAESAARFMVFLSEHTQELAESGHLGIIYDAWTKERAEAAPTGTATAAEQGRAYIRVDSGDVDGRRGTFYEGAFIASRIFAGYEHKTYFNEVSATEECYCEPCLPSDPDEICNGRYRGVGYECKDYDGSRSKWSEMCVSLNQCTLPGEDDYEIECDVIYNNGTRTTETYHSDDIAETPQLYMDVIASIEEGYGTPCFNFSGNYISYVKIGEPIFQATPTMFRTDGDTAKSCTPLEGFDLSFCGYTPPVSDREMHCEILGVR